MRRDVSRPISTNPSRFADAGPSQRCGVLADIKDSTAAMVIALSLFLSPATRPRSLAQYKNGPRLLSWERAARGVPWDVTVILAGGCKSCATV